VPSTRLYYDDSYTVRFVARVLSFEEVGGRPAVELESTYFYPEGGGQEADRGRVGEAPVVDVQAGDDGRVWHFVPNASRPLSGEREAEVDWTRRFDHMQQHTGQHILSAAFEHELGAATLSSHLGEERSTLELDLRDADWRGVERIERAANSAVWDDLPVERHWVEGDEVRRFALRKPPKVSGRIRIVEIPGWDVSACGGTHTRRTGEVGVIKIVRWERVRGNVRFEFLCGGRALRDYAWRAESLVEASRRRTVADRELIALLERAAAERDDLRKRVRELSERLLRAEAAERVGRPPRPVAEFRESWPREEVRLFALKCLEAEAPWVVAATAGPDPALVVARAKTGAGDLRTLVDPLRERSGGKGGGSPDFLQFSASDGPAARAAWVVAVAELPGLTGVPLPDR
jgi:alanyl-tRNA synthetase